MPNLKIGPVELDSPVILAPMSGVTDLPFRRLVRRFGVGLVVSEMIASEAMIRQCRDSRKISTNCADESPMAVQLAGADPVVMAEAARLNEDRGAAIIDINFGCPVKKVVNRQCGSALMRDEALAARLIEATVNAVSVPVTVNMRLGWDDANRNAPSLARVAEAAGAQMITVHGRTRCQLFQGNADWQAIAAVKAAVSLPVIANGDIDSIEAAESCLTKSEADGVMIGRGAYGRPWLPSQVAAALAGQPVAPDPSLADQAGIVHEHYDGLLSHYGTRIGVPIARKHLGWYGKGLPGAAAFRATVNKLDDPASVKRTIDAYFLRPLEQAA
jgi:tRNA-dihydrouridine synthase B